MLDGRHWFPFHNPNLFSRMGVFAQEFAEIT